MARKSNDTEFICEYALEDHKIMTMEAEKRERVITEALKEFSKGYAYANTDEIVKHAEISKGLLFHYFGSKKGVLLFLLKYALNIINAKAKTVLLEKNDCLENIWLASKMKVDLSFEYPDVIEFLAKAAFSIHEIFPERLPEDVPDLASSMLLKRIMENADMSLFKADIDAQKAQHIILWTMNGFIENLRSDINDTEDYKNHYDRCIEELEGYLQLLRKMLYK